MFFFEHGKHEKNECFVSFVFSVFKINHSVSAPLRSNIIFLVIVVPFLESSKEL